MFNRNDLEAIDRVHLTRQQVVGSYSGLFYTNYPQLERTDERKELTGFYQPPAILDWRRSIRYFLWRYGLDRL
jgi:hypothetical protein